MSSVTSGAARPPSWCDKRPRHLVVGLSDVCRRYARCGRFDRHHVVDVRIFAIQSGGSRRGDARRSDGPRPTQEASPRSSPAPSASGNIRRRTRAITRTIPRRRISRSSMISSLMFITACLAERERTSKVSANKGVMKRVTHCRSQTHGMRPRLRHLVRKISTLTMVATIAVAAAQAARRANTPRSAGFPRFTAKWDKQCAGRPPFTSSTHRNRIVSSSRWRHGDGLRERHSSLLRSFPFSLTS